jgi:hypothetical protein
LHLQHFLTPRWASISIQKQCSPLPVVSWLQSFCMWILTHFPNYTLLYYIQKVFNSNLMSLEKWLNCLIAKK